MSDKTILIIDDSYTSLLLMDDVLKHEGYHTQLALDVEEAVKLIRVKIPDLIILDLNLPETSGYDFLKMKAEVMIEKVPVIVVSALDSPESIQQTKILGVSDFISKPIDISKTIQSIKSLMG